MSDALEQARNLIGRYDEEVRRLIPPEVEIFDAHVHCGRDIDGFVGDFEELTAFLRSSGASRAFCFCMDEPDRHPAFSAANDRTLAAAERSEGRLIPFARLDLTEHPIEEATRCLDRGARGIKLHPRAQGFLLNDVRLEPIFALAAERRAPILIHGGRGLPPIADHLARLMDRHSEARLIIAHGGIADLGALAETFAENPSVFFDTSVWGAIDLLDVYSRLSPQQIVYASDFPYGQQPGQLLLDLRAARLAGYSQDEVRDVLGRNAARIADGETLPTPSPPKLGIRVVAHPISLARIHNYLTMTIPLLWTRQPDTIGALGLALNATAERDGQPEVCGRIAELLSCARDLWRSLSEVEDDAEQRHVRRATFALLHLADIEAMTAPPPRHGGP